MRYRGTLWMMKQMLYLTIYRMILFYWSCTRRTKKSGIFSKVEALSIDIMCNVMQYNISGDLKLSNFSWKLLEYTFWACIYIIIIFGSLWIYFASTYFNSSEYLQINNHTLFSVDIRNLNDTVFSVDVRNLNHMVFPEDGWN